MTAERIKEIMLEEPYEYFGLRMCNKRYRVGDVCDNSRQWFQDVFEGLEEYNDYLSCWDGGELPGTCACELKWEADIETIGLAMDYVIKNYSYGKNDRILYLIAGNNAEYGLDEGEIIISNAIVLDF